MPSASSSSSQLKEAICILCVSHKLRLTDGASRSIFLADFLRMKFAAPTSCRSQLVGAEEFVFSRRLEKIERLAPSRESTLFLTHIPVSPVQQYGSRAKSELSK
eukprot:COSAG02_NODE_1100_length_14582_cov_130.690672_11_plen_104_part_00